MTCAENVSLSECYLKIVNSTLFPIPSWLSTKANFTCAFASQFSSWNVVNASGLIVYMRIRCILCSQTYAHFNMSVRVSLSILCSLCRSPRQTHSTTHSLALNWLKKHFSLSPLAKRKGNTCNVFAAALSRSARRIERVSAVFQREQTIDAKYWYLLVRPSTWKNIGLL